MKACKKAQTGLNAAILVTIISALIVIYILFLPTSEKEKFFNGDKESGSNATSKDVVLLREFPGTLSSVSGVEDEKTLPNIFLVESVNAKELLRINPFIISSSSFGKKSRTEEFTLEDADNIDNVILTFIAGTRDGILTIRFNDKVIFESEMKNDHSEPVKINRNILSKNNKIEFSVSSPGASFWKSNKYSLDDVRVIGDITDRRQQESQNLFVMSDTEFNNIKKATLQFIPYCKNVRDVGVLDVYINNRKIFSAVPVCDDPYKQIIPTGALRAMENTVVFKTNRGSYSVEMISVNLEFKDVRVRPFFFELAKEQYMDLNQSKKEVVATLRFVDDETLKDLIFDINGHRSSIETRKSSFTKKLDANLTNEGNNFIRLIPIKEDVDVAELKVEFVRK